MLPQILAGNLRPSIRNAMLVSHRTKVQSVAVQQDSVNMARDLPHDLATNGVATVAVSRTGDTQAAQAKTAPLSTWDQSTSRFHVRIVACFPLDNAKRCMAEKHLKGTVKRLSKGRTDLAARLHLGPRVGWVYQTQRPDLEIPFEPINIDSEFPYTYDELKKQSFPASAFVHPRYDFAGTIRDHGDFVPVAGIRAFFIDGGLILSINFHHTFGDGELLLDFLNVFAAATRGNITAKRGNRSLDFARRANGLSRSLTTQRTPTSPSFDELVKRCPEMTLLADKSGPNQPTALPGGKPESEYSRDGRIFVFHAKRMEEMRSTVQQLAPADSRPSAYTCLATLMWVHSARARCKSEKCLPSWGKDKVATMSNPVNWRQRAFRGKSDDYFGNAVTLAQTHVPVGDVADACADAAAWARLVRRVEGVIRTVDDEYVRCRLEMIDACPDPRGLGLAIDGRIPQDLAFNTWRAFGADTEWDLCGDGHARKPDSLRRAQVVWNMGGTLILPARKDSQLYEVLLTIPTLAMDALIADREFMRWVDRVI